MAIITMDMVMVMAMVMEVDIMMSKKVGKRLAKAFLHPFLIGRKNKYFGYETN